MQIKRALVVLLAAMAALSMCSCGAKDKDLGTIKKVKKTAIETTEEAADTAFSGTENNTGYKMLGMNDYFAGYRMPYPSGWKKTVESANLIKIYDEKTKTTIYIEHTLDTYQNNEIEEPFDLSSFLLNFDAKLNEETFDTTKETGLKRYVDQDVEKPANGTEVNTKDKVLICNDYPRLKMANGDTYEGVKMSERRYYMRLNYVDTVISVVCPQKQFDKMKLVADYIATNVTPITENYSSVRQRSLFSSKDTFDLPKIFVAHNINSKVGNGKVYAVPTTSQSSLAGAFVQIYSVDKDYKLGKNTINYNNVFSSLYSEESKHMTNIATTYDSTPTDKSSGCVVDAVNSHLNSKYSLSGKAYYTDYMIYRTGLGGSRLIEHGDTWAMESFVLQNDQGKKKLVIVGYLQPRRQAMISVAEGIFS